MPVHGNKPRGGASRTTVQIVEAQNYARHLRYRANRAIKLARNKITIGGRA